MVYEKNTSRKQDNIQLEKIFKFIYKIDLDLKIRWDKNSWFTVIRLDPVDPIKNRTNLKIHNDEISDKLKTYLEKYGFKCLRTWQRKCYLPGTWSTNPKEKEQSYSLELIIGKLSEELKWRLDRI